MKLKTKKLFWFFLVGLLVMSHPGVVLANGVDLGNLTNYLFVFTNGSTDANWQAASKGYVGDVAVNGLSAKERTSGTFPYAGTIYTNDNTLGAWQAIVDKNPGQAFASTGQTARINGLLDDLNNAFGQAATLAVSSGYESTSYSSLDNLNTQNGTNELFVINITSGFNDISKTATITGDAGDFFILRWDSDGNPNNGYQGTVKFNNTQGIVPAGELMSTNFISFAGNLNASGGGGARFTGYWLTTGDPKDGKFETDPFSNAVFDGGWYTSTTKFSMTSGTSGVYFAPPPPVPLPGALLLLGSGLVCLVAYGRRKRQST
jgi:hypothetical protein